MLLHTYIDSLRLDEDRKINHHGRKRDVGGGGETSESVKNAWHIVSGKKI